MYIITAIVVATAAVHSTKDAQTLPCLAYILYNIHGCGCTYLAKNNNTPHLTSFIQERGITKYVNSIPVHIFSLSLLLTKLQVATN